MKNVLWKLPVCSSGLTGPGGFRELNGRKCLLVIATKEDDGAELFITFEGVEAYRVTFYRGRTYDMIETSYDELIDLGETEWLSEVKRCMDQTFDLPGKLSHLVISFDEGPYYELICRAYLISGDGKLYSKPF